MASYNELIALIDAFIKRNGVQAITGQILNGVLKAMVDQVGRGYAIMGVATPSTNPGTPDAPESWFASTPGTYTNFGGLEVADAEFALLSYTPTGEVWTKTTLTEGIQEVSASIDGNVGTPEVTAEYINGGLVFTFSNMKGQTGDAAGFGTVNATVDGNIGTPGVSVQTSGPDTAKNMTFQFTNLKGETGVTSVVVTVDNTTGNPACAVSLSGQVLHLDFTGLKGAQGDTGVSADFPITIANNLTTDDPTAALSAAQGVVLAGELSQLEAKVTDNTNDIDSIQNQLDNYQPIVIEGNVENAPDEEDITTDENDLLKFANRAAHTNYLGYVILRKGKTFASQVTVPNTIYEIRYNFDLDGNEFSMPSGCTLYFVGGSLENGAIIGNNTRVSAPSYPVFIPGVRKTRRYILNSQKGKVVQDTHDLSISGTWDNDYVDPAWVGLLDIVQTEDNSLKLNKYFSLFKAGAKVIVPRNDYPVYNRVSVPQGASVDFCGSIIRNMNFSDAYDGTIEIPSGATEIPLVSVYGTLAISGEGVSIENLTLDGGRDVNHDDDGVNLGVGSSSMLDIVNAGLQTKDVVVKNVHFRNISFTAVTTGEIRGDISFVGCSWNDVGEHSVYTHLVSGLFSMRDCRFTDVGNNTYAYNLRGASLIVKFAGNVDIDENGPSQDLLNLRAEYHDCIFDNSGSLYGVLAPSSIILKSDFYGCRFSNILGYTAIASFTEGLERYAEYNFFGCTDPVTKYSAVNTISNLYDCHFTGSRSYFWGDRKNVFRCDGLLSYANDTTQSNFTAAMQTLFPDVYAQRTIVKDCRFAVAGSSTVSIGINDYIGIDFYNTIFDFTKYTISSTLLSIGSFSAVSDKIMNFFDCRFVFSSGNTTIAYDGSKELIVNFYGGEKIGKEGNILTRAGVARLFGFIYQVRLIDVKNIPVFSIENSKFSGAYDAYYREIETTINTGSLKVNIPNSYGNGNYLTKQSSTFDLSRATKVYQLDNFAEEASYTITDAITLYANGDTSYNWTNCSVEFSGITKATRVKIIVDLRHNY